MVPLLRKQSVAEHSFNVTVIAEAIFKVIVPDGKPPSELYRACLYHDIDETVTGDIPSPTKKKLSIYELGPIDYNRHKMELTSAIITFCLKAADYIDAYMFCATYSSCKYCKEVAHGIWQNLIAFWKDAPEDYRNAARQILNEARDGEIQIL